MPTVVEFCVCIEKFVDASFIVTAVCLRPSVGFLANNHEPSFLVEVSRGQSNKQRLGKAFFDRGKGANTPIGV